MFLFFIFSILSYSYDKGDKISIYGAKISPKNSPSQSYSFKHLPFCTVPKDSSSLSSLSDRITGKDIYPLNIPIEFGVPKKRSPICASKLTDDSLIFLKKAAYENFWALFYIDNIPIYEHISTFEKGAPVIYTHYSFDFFYNKDKIIDCNLSMSEPCDIISTKPISFHITTYWKEVDTNVSQMFDRYKESRFYEHRIRGFSLGNNFLTVIFLVLIILITLAKMLVGNFSQNMSTKTFQGFELDLSTEKGWKTLHGDIFRPPPTKRIVSMCVGAGAHLFFTLFFYLLINKSTLFYTARSGYVTVFIFSLIASSPFAGYFSAAVSRDYGESKWKQVSTLSAGAAPILFFIIQILISCNSSLNDSKKSIPFYYIFFFAAVLFIVIFPLGALGGFLGVRSKLFSGPKCEVSLVPRAIPKPKFGMSRAVVCLLVGAVISIPLIIEFYYLLATIWNMKFYYTWSLSILFLILISIITALTSVIGISIIIQNEDHRWQWPSFCGPASVGLFCFGYCIYFWIKKIEMIGIYQLIDYLLTSLFLCSFVSLCLGCIGFVSCNLFIHKVFQILKFD